MTLNPGCLLIDVDGETYTNGYAALESITVMGYEDPDNDGVEGIEADANGLFKVYNLNGVKVMETEKLEELKSRKGVYIINGKKIAF